jgi:glycosyltransferase involved in cell wall biosynthesis
MTPLFSIIIPVRKPTSYLNETLAKLKQQSEKRFEVIVVTDKISGPVSPATKRNLGSKKAKGEYLAFLDDDSYPSPDWLKNTKKLFTNEIVAVCGPCLTPPGDDIYKQASGLVWSSHLGSGGAGEYRNNIAKSRFVDDFPSVNLIVKKADFLQVNGFNTHHWPGEDTILCLDLTHKLHKKILYHPSVQVFHHRRPVLIPHLQQITRYAIHRGLFARIYPETSLRLGYLLPSLFFIYLLLLPLLPKIFLVPIFIYLLLLLITFFTFILKNKFITSLLATITIPITHLYYGIFFILGLFKKELGFVPRKT